MNSYDTETKNIDIACHNNELSWIWQQIIV